MGPIEPHIMIANIIGGVGIFCCAMIFQQTNRRRLLLWKLLADGIWALQYLILGAYGGMGTALIAVVRDIIFLRRDPQKGKGVGWLVAFLIMSVTVAALTWKNAWNIFTLTASVIGVTSFWIGKPKISRILSFPIAVCLLIYDISTFAVAGVINECMSMTSSTVGIIRHDISACKTAKQPKTLSRKRRNTHERNRYRH